MPHSPEELILCAGGLNGDGSPRNALALWDLLEGAPSVSLFDQSRTRVVGEIRLVPGGSGVYFDGRGYSFLSPEELGEIVQSVPCRL